MRFKLDENLPDSVRVALTALGHDAHTVVEEQLAGAQDATVLDACIAEDRILVTLDLDFSDIRSYPPGSYPGIWVLRPAKQTFATILGPVRRGFGWRPWSVPVVNRGSLTKGACASMTAWPDPQDPKALRGPANPAVHGTFDLPRPSACVSHGLQTPAEAGVHIQR